MLAVPGFMHPDFVVRLVRGEFFLFVILIFVLLLFLLHLLCDLLHGFRVLGIE